MGSTVITFSGSKRDSKRELAVLELGDFIFHFCNLFFEVFNFVWFVGLLFSSGQPLHRFLDPLSQDFDLLFCFLVHVFTTSEFGLEKIAIKVKSFEHLAA